MILPTDVSETQKVHLQGLRQAEQMVLSPMPAQLFGDLFLTLPAARVPQLG
jgi:hypothetical protein